jgi:hypothetical protein
VEAIFLERRTIFRNYTGLYILGVDGGLITQDLLSCIESNIRTPTDLFLQIEPLIEREKSKEKKEEINGIYKKNPPLLSFHSSFLF